MPPKYLLYVYLLLLPYLTSCFVGAASAVAESGQKAARAP